MKESALYAVTSTATGLLAAPFLPIIATIYCIIMWKKIDESKIARPLV
jgi:hypothetical protein